LSAPVLTDLLAAAEAALDRGDPLAAAEAVAAAARACAELEASHTSLPPQDLPHLRELHARLSGRAAAARDEVAGQLAALDRSRRARTAYGRR
jgi:hypothetical protein